MLTLVHVHVDVLRSKLSQMWVCVGGCLIFARAYTCTCCQLLNERRCIWAGIELGL